MANSTTQTSIINRALQLLGYQAVASITQVGDRGAKAMNRAYEPVKISLLTENYWAFSIKRASLPEDAVKPVHTKTYRYALPGDYLMLAPEDQASDFPLANDWIIEGNHIVTNDSAPLLIRYISNAITENFFHPLFAEAFSYALAVSTCEELTQSNGKITTLASFFDRQITLAKNRNAILVAKPKAPASPWISKRV